MTDFRTGRGRPRRSLTLELMEKSLEDCERPSANDDLLTPREVADILGVNASTVTRWSRIGRLRVALSTPGGHRRYLRGDVLLFRSGTNGTDPVKEKMEGDAVRLYEQGWSIRQVAAQFECSYGAMRRILLKRTALRDNGGKSR